MRSLHHSRLARHCTPGFSFSACSPENKQIELTKGGADTSRSHSLDKGGMVPVSMSR
jgi:hypothetical protein